MLEATVRDPSRSGPGARLIHELEAQERTGVGRQPDPHFHACEASPEGTGGLICWTKLICFADVPELARFEIAAFRYRVLHVAARLTSLARRLRLRIDKTWRWAAHIAAAFHRIRAAFA